MQIIYKSSSFAWANYPQLIREIIIENNFKNICELGGGADPLLSLEFVEKHQLNYLVTDISKEELEKSNKSYQTKILDFSDSNFKVEDKFDFVFSKMVLEHVKKTERLHNNIFLSLNPGGKAFHFFPSITILPSFINYLLPEFLGLKILDLVQKRSVNRGKFIAYYNWCFGPTKKNINRFQTCGYIIEQYYGFFGHKLYKKIPPLMFLEELKTNMLLKKPNPYFCSHGIVLLGKKLL